MRIVVILVSGAITFGLAAGYAWSSLSAPAARKPAPVKAALVPLPASPEERPVALDQQWTEQAGGGPVASLSAAPDRPVYYAGCNAVRAAGKAPLYAGDPGYRTEMDGDDDGIACEPIRGQ